MNASGYVRIYRTLLDHPAFRNDGEAMAFAWMVVRASWKPCRVRYKGAPITLSRGQLAVSVRDLADRLDRPKGWAERLLARLRNETMIETRSETGVTVITICNYDDYQFSADDGETAQETVGGTRAGQRQDTEQVREEREEEREEANASSPRAHRGRGWPEIPDWIPAAEWNAFLDMRKRKRAFPTAHAVNLLIGKLEKLRRSGCDPGAVLDQSTVKNWTDVYELKDNRNGSSSSSHRDTRDGFERAADRRMDHRADSGASGEAGRPDDEQSADILRLPLPGR